MKMTLLGTGVRTPFVLHGLADREAELGLTEVVLHDTDHERLRIMSASAPTCSASGSPLHRPWRAGSAHGDRRLALRVLGDPRGTGGGSGERRADRARHGVLGQETTGPGGSRWRSARSP